MRLLCKIGRFVADVVASMDHASPGNALGLLNLSGSYTQNLSFLEEFMTRPRARSELAVTEATT